MGDPTSTSHTGYALLRRWELKVNQSKERRYGSGYNSRVGSPLVLLSQGGGAFLLRESPQMNHTNRQGRDDARS
jgi:hypothetical protein